MSETKEDNFGIPVSSEIKGDTLTQKMRENPWILATFVLGVLTLILFVASLGGVTGNIISEKMMSGEKVGDNLLKFFESKGVTGLSIDSIGEISGVYEINFSYNGQIVPYYSTKDGKLIGSLSPISTEETSSTETTDSTTTEIPKNSMPIMELFVMTHCPYGTQAEKGFIPFIEAFGNSVNAKIRFVHYTMHGEKEDQETIRQVCIREEQNAKYLSYLKCFLEGNGVVDTQYNMIMEGNDPDACMKKVGVDVNKVATCISSGKGEEYYKVDSELSQKYGVQGSPTLVINGVMASTGRSPSAFLDAACKAFSDDKVPSNCGTIELSTTNPTPYFGWDEAESESSSSSGLCS